jgi:hypothetical protein
MTWLTWQDGYVISAKLNDWDVWLRCQTFGAPAARLAIDNWIKNIEKKLDKISDP